MVTRAFLILPLALLPTAAQQAPPARDFGRVLWTNTRGLFSSQNVVPAVFGLTAAGSASLLDHRAQDYFGGERVAPTIGSIGSVLGNSLTLGGVSGILFYTSYRGNNERLKAMSFDLTEAIVLDAALVPVVKAAVRRERPDQSNKLSFYSGHASATTAAATVVSHYYPKAAIPVFLLAGFVGFSRIESNRHWLSDVVAGHAIGFIIGRTAIRGHSPLKVGRLDWAPAAAPGGGFMIDARISLASEQ